MSTTSATLARALVLQAALAQIAGVGTAAPQAGGEQELQPPAHAQTQVARDLLEASRRARNPADGAGRAWLAEGGPAVAGSRGRWRIEFEAGPLGVAEGGAVYLQVSPFWGWSTPQIEDPRASGFTRVACDARASSCSRARSTTSCWRRSSRGARLTEGERVSFDYGAGPPARWPTTTPRIARACGSRSTATATACGRVLADSPCVAVLPGAAAAARAARPVGRAARGAAARHRGRARRGRQRGARGLRPPRAHLGGRVRRGARERPRAGGRRRAAR